MNVVNVVMLNYFCEMFQMQTHPKEEYKERGEEKKEKENTYTEEFKKFNSWLKEHCPSVAKLKTQLTEEEMNYLITTYTKERFFDILLQMENKKDLTSKYKSVYLTANNWLKR